MFKKKLTNKSISCALVSFPTIKPIDEKVIRKYATCCKLIVTIEEHNIVGGFGSAVAEILSENENNCKLLRIGLNDTYSSVVGNQDYLRKIYGIDSKSIEEKILNEIK